MIFGTDFTASNWTRLTFFAAESPLELLVNAATASEGAAGIAQKRRESPVPLVFKAADGHHGELPLESSTVTARSEKVA